jgi:hypothetical protein
MPRARTRGLTEINVQVTVHKGGAMGLGDAGPWPERSAATFVFGGDGAAARVSVRVVASELQRLAELVEMAQARTTQRERGEPWPQSTTQMGARPFSRPGP